MGMNATAHLVYGIPLGESDEEYPWNTEEFGGDFDYWYLTVVLKFTPTNGPYKDEKPGFRNYFMEEHKFKQNLPFKPLELIYACSDACPEYVLSIEGFNTRADCGEYMDISDTIKEVGRTSKEHLIQVVKEYNLCQEEYEPTWLLTASYG